MLAGVAPLLVVAARARACSFGEHAVQAEGVPGISLGFSSAEGRKGEIPPNPVFFTSHSRPVVVLDGDRELELLDFGPDVARSGLRLVTLASSLPPGSVVRVGRGDLGVDSAEVFTVGPELDERPPETPVVTHADMNVHDGEGTCSGDSCGDFATVSFQVEPLRDDETFGEHVVLALYLGTSAKQARETDRPTDYLVVDGDTAFAFVDHRFGEDDVYATLSAIDRAGNESARTEPLHLHQAPSACAVGGGARAFSHFWAIAAAIGWLARRRRHCALGA